MVFNYFNVVWGEKLFLDLKMRDAHNMKEKFQQLSNITKKNLHISLTTQQCVYHLDSILPTYIHIHTHMYHHEYLYPHNNNMIYLVFTLFLIELRTKKGLINLL